MINYPLVASRTRDMAKSSVSSSVASQFRLYRAQVNMWGYGAVAMVGPKLLDRVGMNKAAGWVDKHFSPRLKLYLGACQQEGADFEREPHEMLNMSDSDIRIQIANGIKLIQDASKAFARRGSLMSAFDAALHILDVETRFATISRIPIVWICEASPVRDKAHLNMLTDYFNRSFAHLTKFEKEFSGKQRWFFRDTAFKLMSSMYETKAPDGLIMRLQHYIDYKLCPTI